MNLIDHYGVINMLTNPQELMRILDNHDLIIIDCRSYKEYAEGHIPKSVNLDFFYYHWSDTTKEGIKSFEIQMKNLLSFVGVTRKKKIIFYDEVAGMSAARGLWLLSYFSHPNVSILDGGFKKWKNLGFPIEIKTNGFTPAKFSGKIDKKILADFQYIQKNLNKIKIIDARTREEYDGKVIRAARRGHIPKSVNIDWVLNINEDGTMKSKEDLKKLFNFSKNDEIVTYCQGGYRAANTFVALKRLGFKNVKVYLGSWGEWGNRLNLPVELEK